MPSPHVSILLPAFNAGNTLPACLRSIQRQAETEWECIVVEDGSTDDTAVVARSFARDDSRFLVVQTPHAGIVAALNTGIERCRGTYVARMDADDVMHRDRLHTQAAALERSDWAAVGCHVRLFPRDGMTLGRREYESWLNSIDSPQRIREDAFVECPVAHPALMIRTDVLVVFGYRDQGWAEDYDLVLRLLAAGYDIGVVPRRLMCWRDHPGRSSRVSGTYALDRFIACKAAFLAAGFLAGHAGYVLCGYGETGRALYRALRAHGKRPSHIVDVHPRRIGNMINGVPVIAPEGLERLRGTRIIAAVAGSEQRQRIRAALRDLGFEERRDFICAA